VVEFGDLRGEVARRIDIGRHRARDFSERRHGVPPV
jgi:hypothetical protein